jgi:hypothetical protein
MEAEHTVGLERLLSSGEGTTNGFGDNMNKTQDYVVGPYRQKVKQESTLVLSQRCPPTPILHVKLSANILQKIK